MQVRKTPVMYSDLLLTRCGLRGAPRHRSRQSRRLLRPLTGAYVCLFFLLSLHQRVSWSLKTNPLPLRASRFRQRRVSFLSSWPSLLRFVLPRVDPLFFFFALGSSNWQAGLLVSVLVTGTSHALPPSSPRPRYCPITLPCSGRVPLESPLHPHDTGGAKFGPSTNH